MKNIFFRYKLLLTTAMAFSLLVTSTKVGYAFVFQRLVDFIAGLNLSGALISIGIMVVVFALSSCFSYLQGYFLNKYFRDTFILLKNKLFMNFIGSDYRQFYKRSGGDYLNTITTLTNDMKTGYILPIYTALTSSALALFSLAAIFYYNLMMGALALFILLIQTLVPVLRKKPTEKSSENYAKETAAFSSKTMNLIGGFELIASQNIRAQAFELFSSSNKSLEQSRFKMNNIINLSNALIFFVRMILILLPWFAGAALIIRGDITFGAMMAISQLNNSLAEPFAQVITSFNQAVAGKEIAAKVKKDLEDIICEEKTELDIQGALRSVTLKNIGYSYDGKTQVLSGVNLTFEAGKKYALLGKSGSGKSTLGKILSGLLTDYTGEIYINETLINSKKDDISKIIGYCPQETYLFNDTLGNNITLYRDLPKDELDFILQKLEFDNIAGCAERGYETALGSSGQLLSGGQKQRVGLARLLINKVPVIVLDESTSSLDMELYQEVEKFILSLENITVISIAHRPGDDVIRKYDDVLFL